MSRALALFHRDARLALSYPVTFWMQWFSIFVTVAGLWLVSRLVPPSVNLGVSRNYFDYALVNVAFFSLQAAALQSFSRAIRNDQFYGTLEVLLVTPTPLPLLVCAPSLWSFAITLAKVAWYLLVASLIFGFHIGAANVGLALGVLGLIVASSAAVGILSAAAIVRFKQDGIAGLFAGGAASLLSGVLFPVALLPAPLGVVSWLLPMTHGLAAIRTALAGGSWLRAAADIEWLLVATALLLPLALVAFRAAVTRTRRDGTLGHY